MDTGRYIRSVHIVLGGHWWHWGGHGELYRRVLWGTFRGRLLARKELYGRRGRVARRQYVSTVAVADVGEGGGVVSVSDVGGVEWRGVQ